VIQFHGLEPLYFARLRQESERARRPLSWRYCLVKSQMMFPLLRYSCQRADMILTLNSEELRFLVDHGWAKRD